MAKSKKVVSKKAQAEAPALEVAPVAASAPMPVAAETPSKPAKARKEKVADEPAVKWARRLKRWQAKAVAAGVDARALMEEALAA